MEFARPYRIALSSTFAVTLALGGYFIGYAKTDSKVQEPNFDSPTYFGKVPPEIGYKVAQQNAKQLKITPEELAKVKRETEKLLPEYFAAQKQLWTSELNDAKLLEEGKILKSTREDVIGLAELHDMDNREKAFNAITAKLEITIFQIIGQKKMHDLNQIRKHYPADSTAKSLDMLLQPSMRDSLGLTQPQRNQIIMLQSFFAKQIRNPKALLERTIHIEDVVKDQDRDREALIKGDPNFKTWIFFDLRGFLSPTQKVKLNGLLRNSLYVNP